MVGGGRVKWEGEGVELTDIGGVGWILKGLGGGKRLGGLVVEGGY